MLKLNNALKVKKIKPFSKKNFSGFTLSELLLTLAIVGIVAVLTIPVLMNNVQNKMFATQVKNMTAEIQTLVEDVLNDNHTRDLSDTDFSDPEELLTEKHFKIVKTCPANESLAKCWKTGAIGDAKVKYKKINNTNAAIEAQKTIILKNGVMLAYSTIENENILGQFIIDVNGNDKPNIIGRDVFGFYVDNKGHIMDYSKAMLQNDSLETKISKCTTESTGAFYCYGALRDKNWKMVY